MMMREHVDVAVVQYAHLEMRQRQANIASIKKRMHIVAQKGAELAVFPEMCITSFFVHEPDGYARYWREGTISVDGPEIQEIVGAAIETEVHVVVGFAERGSSTGVIYNSAALIGPDGVLGVTRKMHLPGLEKLYYAPSEKVSVINSPFGRIGIAICYDAMFPEYLRKLSEQNVEIILFCSSVWSGGAKGGVGEQGVKRRYWSVLPQVTAIQNQAFVLACNGCGSLYMGEQAGTWERLGLSCIVAPTGRELAAAGGNGSNIIYARLDEKDLVAARTSYRFLTDRRL